jgi:hypothetical protein
MTSPLTKKQWEASVAEMWSASVKATCQDLIDEAVKAERERMTVVAMDAAEKAVDAAIKLEREACALICDAVTQDMSLGPLEKYRAAEIAKLIRARGQA